MTRKLTLALALGAFLIAPMGAAAKPNINDMQGCQALIDFVDYRMAHAPKKYAKADVKAVRAGLAGYDKYIQSTIVTPGLLEFNGGDKGKAKAMQKQVDDYKATVTAAYKQEFSQNRLYTDFALSLNDCAKKAVPAGKDLEALKAALETMLKLARQE
ncbi:MAG: hypothetical protein V3U82_01470 [Robiginitomaculum sp.]